MIESRDSGADMSDVRKQSLSQESGVSFEAMSKFTEFYIRSHKSH